MFEGCTGGVGLHVTLAQEPVVLARLTYLSFNLSFIILNLLAGYYVYETTKSLTLEVDLLAFGCEVLAVTINIAIEVAKRKSMRPRSIMVLDLVGGLASLSLLIVVGLFGVFNAISTTEELNDVKRRSPEPASHLSQMLQFSTFSLCLSVLNLSIFARLREKMLPDDGDVHDQLNLLSNLAHSLVDFVTNFAVLGTSLWLKYGIGPDTWLEMRKHKVLVDVFGSFIVCACILVSIVWLLRDVVNCVRWIHELGDPDLEGSGLECAAGVGSKTAEALGKAAGATYGSTETSAAAA